MKVIHTIASLAAETGGPARTVRGLSAALSAAGADITLLTVAASDTGGDAGESSSGQVDTFVVKARISLGERRLWAPDFERALQRLVESERCQVIHDHGLWEATNQAAARVAESAGLPLIVSLRGTLEPWSRQHHRWRKQIAWRLYQRRHLRQARLIHVTSENEAQSARMAGLDTPLAIIPNGVDVSIMERPGVRVDKTIRTLLFLSRIHPIKGLLNLVEALRQIDLSGWRVILAGGDEDGHRAMVEAAVQAARLDGKVVFHGSVTDADKWELYRQADLFVLPSYSENFGLVVAEALASGVPVITTTGTPWQILQTHACGWWVDIGPGPLAAALRDAMALSDAERLAMGARGRQLVMTHFGWPAIARQMLAAYAWVVGEGPVPDCVRPV